MTLPPGARDARRIGGGDINEAFRVVLADGSDAFVKTRGDADERAKVRLLREFDPGSAAAQDLDVPDPYYGASGGFEEVFDIVQDACEGLLEQVRAGELP